VERAPFSVRLPSLVASSGASDSGGADSDDTGDAALSLRKVADSEPAAMVVFKTMTDPFSGRITFFKVISGVIKNDATVENYTRRGQERLAHLSIMQGRKAVEVAELHAGDLGAVAKLRETLTGDMLGQKGAEIAVDLVEFPAPTKTSSPRPFTS